MRTRERLHFFFENQNLTITWSCEYECAGRKATDCIKTVSLSQFQALHVGKDYYLWQLGRYYRTYVTSVSIGGELL